MNTQKPPSFETIFNRLNRDFVGFDNLVREFTDTINATVIDKYPPYDIAQLDENNYEITLALAGFDPTQIKVSVEKGYLDIAAKSPVPEDVSELQPQKHYIYKGIATRSFNRKFKLGEHIEVVSAEYRNGLLVVSLERQIPEESKSKVIDIQVKG